MSVKRNLSLLGIVLVMLFFQLSSHGDGEESRWVQGLNVNPMSDGKLNDKKDDAAAELEELFENKIHPKRKQGKSTKYSDNPDKKRDGASKGGDSQMMLQKVAGEKGKAVALVVAYVDIKDAAGKVHHLEDSFGTAWAFAPDKFATNAHVADGIKKSLENLIRSVAKTRVDAELKAAGINKEDFSELGARQVERLKGEIVGVLKTLSSGNISELYPGFSQRLIQAIMQKNGISDEASFMNALRNELRIFPKDGATPIVDILLEYKLAEVCSKLHCSDMKELQIKWGKEVYSQMITGYLKKVYGGLQDYGAMVRINGGNGRSYKIKEYQVHSQYDDGYDVAVMTIDGSHDVYFELADEKVLRELKQGEPIAYVGFPMEGLIGYNRDLHQPIATMQNGIVSKVCDYSLKDSGFANNVLIVHNVPATGGSSGSPLFNRYGQVVGLLNAGNTHKGLMIADGTVLNRIPNAAQVNYGQRVDLLHGKLSSPVSVAGLLQKIIDEKLRVSKEQDGVSQVLSSLSMAKKPERATAVSFFAFSDMQREEVKQKIQNEMAKVDARQDLIVAEKKKVIELLTDALRWMERHPVIGSFRFTDLWMLGEKSLTQEEIVQSAPMQSLLRSFRSTLDFYRNSFDYLSYDGKNSEIKVYYPWYLDHSTENNAVSIIYESLKSVFAFTENCYGSMTVTHEFTHGVTGNSVVVPYRDEKGNTNNFGLEYEGESGALNEGFSDIFACLHALDTNPNLVGDERWTYPGTRCPRDPESMKNPSKYQGDFWVDPSNKRNDNGGVHDNSTVFSHLAFLICDGQAKNASLGKRSVKGIGHVKTRELFWNLLRGGKLSYVQGFGDLALKLYETAMDCAFSESELQSVIDACKEVGLPGSDELGAPVGDNVLASAMYSKSFEGVSRLRSNNVHSHGDVSLLLGDSDMFASRVQKSFHDKGVRYFAVQTYRSIPVYGATALVETGFDGAIRYAHRTYSESIANGDAASSLPEASKEFPDELRKMLLDDTANGTLSEPFTMVFDPAVVRMKGDVCLVWIVEKSVNDIPIYRYFIDQRTNKVVRRLSLTLPPEPRRDK